MRALFLIFNLSLLLFSGDFNLKLHKANFITPLSHYIKANGKTNGDEVDFQISFKKLLLRPYKDIDFYFGYTQKSFWEMYDKQNSSPFRETNYNPELFLDINLQEKKLFFDTVYLGYEHESNGQTVERSRSWNRSYIQGFKQIDGFSFNIKFWSRTPEDKKTDVNDTQGDDNPDILDYYGNSEMSLSYKEGNHKFLLFLRNLESIANKDRYLTREFGYNYKTGDDTDIVVRYFQGYGDSLIDYNLYIEKFSIGVEVY